VRVLVLSVSLIPPSSLAWRAVALPPPRPRHPSRRRYRACACACARHGHEEEEEEEKEEEEEEEGGVGAHVDDAEDSRNSKDGDADDRDQDGSGSQFDPALATSTSGAGMPVPVPVPVPAHVIVPSGMPVSIVPVPLQVPVSVHMGPGGFVVPTTSNGMMSASMNMPPTMPPTMYMGHPPTPTPHTGLWQPQIGGVPVGPGGLDGPRPGPYSVNPVVTPNANRKGRQSAPLRKAHGGRGGRGGGRGYGRGGRGSGRGYGRSGRGGAPPMPASDYGAPYGGMALHNAGVAQGWDYSYPGPTPVGIEELAGAPYHYMPSSAPYSQPLPQYSSTGGAVGDGEEVP